MGKICDYFQGLKNKYNERHNNALLHRSTEIYQVTEYMGKLWFTHNGILFCPCDMVKGEALEALTEIRSLFVARNKVEQ